MGQPSTHGGRFQKAHCLGACCCCSVRSVQTVRQKSSIEDGEEKVTQVWQERGHGGKESSVSCGHCMDSRVCFSTTTVVIFCGKSTGVCLRLNPPIWTTYPGPLEESAETSTEEGRCSWLLCTGSPHCCGRLRRKTPCICREAWRSPGGLSFV